MTDEKTETKPAQKTTPESTKRFRLTMAALRFVEDANDTHVRAAIGEFQTFFQLYVDQRIREVESREPLPFQADVSKFPNTSMIDVMKAQEAQGIQDTKDVIGRGTTPTTNWGDQRIK